MTLPESTIRIRPGQRALSSLFYGALFCSTVGAIVALAIRGRSAGIPVAALTALAALLVILAAAFAWAIVWTSIGLEVISFYSDRLTVERRLRNTTLGTIRTFQSALVRNMRIERRMTRAKGRPIVRYSLVFDYGGQSTTLVTVMSEQVADELLRNRGLAAFSGDEQVS